MEKNNVERFKVIKASKRKRRSFETARNYLGLRTDSFEFNASYSSPNPVTTEFAPKSRTRGAFTSTLGKAISRQSSICLIEILSSAA